MPVPGHSQRYGTAHQQTRRLYVANYWPGQPCVLCHLPMTGPARELDLAHAEGGGYLGLAHRRCNRGWGQAETNRMIARGGVADPLPRSSRTRW
jgi:hypothetical protein